MTASIAFKNATLLGNEAGGEKIVMGRNMQVIVIDGRGRCGRANKGRLRAPRFPTPRAT